MAAIYAALIMKGAKTLADVPKAIRSQVKQLLIELDCPNLADE